MLARENYSDMLIELLKRLFRSFQELEKGITLMEKRENTDDQINLHKQNVAAACYKNEAIRELMDQVKFGYACLIAINISYVVVYLIDNCWNVEALDSKY